jgi:hypothetical protein
MATASIDRIDGVRTTKAIKVSVAAATTANITLSGEQTLDTIAVVADDRVLVKDQTDGTQNGIYDVSTGDWRRAKDFNSDNEIAQGTAVFVNGGAIHGLSLQVIATADPVLGTTALTFQASAVVLAGTYVQISGDKMTGNLEIEGTAPQLELDDTDVTEVMRVRQESLDLIADVDPAAVASGLSRFVVKIAGTERIRVKDTEIQTNMTGSLRVPAGNTAARPSGVTGDVRYNQQLQEYEVFRLAGWSGLMDRSDLLDEDAMGSDSATAPASQQSIKAYADALAPTGIKSTQQFTASGTWTRPAGVTRVLMIVTGSGDTGNSGGGCGGTAIKFLDVSAIASSTITIGAEGLACTWADGTNTIHGEGGNGTGATSGGDINMAYGNKDQTQWSNGLSSFWGGGGGRTGNGGLDDGYDATGYGSGGGLGDVAETKGAGKTGIVWVLEF